MADKPSDKTSLIPWANPQNPAPVGFESQNSKNCQQEQVDRILEVFYQLLPSNYVSQVQGPWYTMQFQAAAEQIAKIQCAAQEAFADGFWEFTRPEFIHQILGTLVFPDSALEGVPTIRGDISYRDFLRAMAKLLLEGSTKLNVQAGIELLTNATIQILEKGIEARKLGPECAWGLEDQWTFEINVEGPTRTVDCYSVGLPGPCTVDLGQFPDDPFTLLENLKYVLKALKPAHTLYDFRFLFREVFGEIFSDSVRYNLETYYYEDFRKYCLGRKQITGEGDTLTDRSLFSDPDRDFSSIRPGAELVLLTGPNSTTASSADEGWVGHYRVIDVLVFPVGDDATPRAYTTSPTGLTGFATVSGDEITDTSQNWALAQEGELLTFASGPNAGTYRLKTLVGNYGGPLGQAPGPATIVKAAPSLLRIRYFMPYVATGQQYTVVVDRLGVQEPHTVTGEDASSQFLGPLPATQSFILTQRGPLVKGWGDATPATTQDVSVTVNGFPVVVTDVNPYIGRIELAVPVPTSNPPPEVLVDYKWMATPIMAFAGLNTEGLTLNKWDRSGGMPSGPRFPMAVVLGPGSSTPTPLYIGHRYLGFEREYSALLNSPTTLRLNQSPHRVAVPGMERATAGLSVSYEGVQVPTVSDPPWALSGTDTGKVNINEGTYTVVDANAGSYNPSSPTAVVYSRTEDIEFSVGRIPRDLPAAVYVVGRFAISDDTLLAPDGVFTGVGFGFHNNERLFLAGALRVNGVSHVGLLRDATQPHLAEAWSIGPKTVATITANNTARMISAEIPPGLAVGDRFQILAPETQAGVYTVAALVHHTDGSTVVTITGTFPANYKLYGNTYPTVYFEVPWEDDPASVGAIENQTTYRLVADPDRGVSQLIISGGVSGLVVETTEPTALPLPAETSLLLEQSDEGGLFFWGSLSWKATSRATWSFFRYGVTPDLTYERDQLITVDTEMQVVPEDDALGDEWALLQNFGYSKIDNTGDTMLLKSTSAHSNLSFAFGYGRTEPFLSPKTNLDVRANFRVDTGVSAGRDLRLEVRDGRKKASLGTLLYREDVGQTPYRQLLKMPLVSFSGILSPLEQNFEPEIADGVFSFENRQQRFILTVGEQYGVPGAFLFQDKASFNSQINLAPWTDSRDRAVEVRFAVTAYTAAGTGEVGTVVLAGVGGFGVFLTLMDGGTPRIRLSDWTPTPIQDFPFDWTDGELHTYRILTDFSADTLVLVIDDVVQVPTLALSAFGLLNDNVLNVGFYSQDIAQSATVEWDSASYLILPPDDAKRTLGVYLGGDADDIDSWEIPRTDSSNARNSEQTGPVIEEMDWTADMDVRMYRDPTWGVTVYRPDIPLPPYYQPETFPPTAGTGFATETTEPSAGWINVEYRNLPTEVSPFGSVTFGALDPEAVTQQRWSFIRYRLHRHPTEDYKAPQGMVLNRFNTIHSGEWTKDVTPEQVIVQPLSAYQVSLLPTHLYADRIFKVIEEGRDPFTPEMFTFDVGTQAITLIPDSEGSPRLFGVTQTGTEGSFAAKSTTFTDISADFSAVLPGHMLHITSGLASGTYMVSGVLSPTSLTVATAFPNPSVGGVPWQITQNPQPVTIVFAPGNPVTNTYLQLQPLLDSVTLLNEGTPPFPKSQLAQTIPVVIHDGGVRNLVDDTPADVQSDNWRVLAFQEVTGTYYEGMQFLSVDDGGALGLLTSICEGQLGIGSSGWSTEGGDKIYSPTGGGPPLGGVGASGGLFETGDTVGSPSGGMVLTFGPYLEQGLGLPKNVLGGIPNPVAFIASGNGYVGPAINQVGSSIAVLEPLNTPGQPGGSVEVILKDTTFFTVDRWFFNG